MNSLSCEKQRNSLTGRTSNTPKPVPKILVVGSSNIDLVVKTRRFPNPGETLVGGEFFLFQGGKGANQAVAAARMGGEVVFISKVGKDLFGNKAKEGLEKEGISTARVWEDALQPTGIALLQSTERARIK
jgi:ribokinase